LMTAGRTDLHTTDILNDGRNGSHKRTPLARAGEGLEAPQGLPGLGQTLEANESGPYPSRNSSGARCERRERIDKPLVNGVRSKLMIGASGGEPDSGETGSTRKPRRWGFLGGGKMATALIRGMLRAKVADAGDIIASDPYAPARSALGAETGVVVIESNPPV